MIRLAELAVPVVIVLIIAFVILRSRSIETKADKVARLERENSVLSELVTGIYGDALVANDTFGDIVVGRIRRCEVFADDPRFKEIGR